MLMLLKFAVALILSMSGPVAGVAYEHAFTTPSEQEPSEEFCLSTGDGNRDAVCVTLYADEDGYELCMSDETAWTERCVSSYRLGDPNGSGDDSPDGHPWSVTDL